MTPRQIGLLAALASIWGGSYLLIKYALEDLDAPVVVFGRTLLAAAALFVALRATGGRRAPREALADARARPGTALLLGTLAVALPFTLITLGELEVPSGLTAVLISPASLFVAMLAPFIDVSERVDRRQAVGMVMGLAGVGLVVGVESVQTLGEFLGALAMLGAAVCYALSSFVVKGSYTGLSSMQTSFVSIMVASVLTLPAAVATAPAELPGLRATLSVLALGVVGTALAFVIFYKLIAEVGAGRASLVSYLAPGVALFYGALLLDETITLAAVAGLVLILAGVALASRARAGRMSPPSDPTEPARRQNASSSPCADTFRAAMDLTLSPPEEEFRDELRGWLADNHPGQEPPADPEQFDFRRAWQRKLNDRGWAGLSWPEAYGGAGATLVEQAIFYEEIARAGAPPMANVLGLAMGGPTVIAHGDEPQKDRYLAPILSAEEIWCQGFSEPDSGSDLASLKTRAVRSGDGWLVTGQKVWTTLAHQAKWCMLVARTDPDVPKHRGLSYFLMDMEQEGVEIRPLRQITGESEFNELFLQEARVPHANIIGGENNGWAVAITTLMHERAGLAFALQVDVQIALRELVASARESGAGADPVVRQRLAQLYIEAQALRLNAYRGLTATMKRGAPGPEGSLGKWHWAEVNQALTDLALDLAGARAQLGDDLWAYRFLRARGNSIEGGTTEILKNIVAERVLGLPRG